MPQNDVAVVVGWMDPTLVVPMKVGALKETNPALLLKPARGDEFWGQIHLSNR